MHFSLSSIDETQKKLSENTIQEPVLLYVGSHDFRENLPDRMLHSHEDIVEFVCFLDGKGKCTVGDRQYTVCKGDLVIYNAGVMHLDNFGLLYFCGAANIHLPALPANTIIPPGTSPVLHLGPHENTITGLLSSMHDIASRDSQNASESCQLLFRVFLNQLLNLINEATEFSDNFANSDSQKKRGREIQRYVDEHILGRLSLSEIAEHFQLSTFYVSRVFKATTGQTLNEYQTRQRIGQAQNLLLTTSLPLSEIAIKSGYGNQGYFSKQFTKLVGISPLQYRKQLRGKTVEK